jgi:hypothetical protein
VYIGEAHESAEATEELDLDDYINAEEEKRDTPADIDAYEFLKDVSKSSSHTTTNSRHTLSVRACQPWEAISLEAILRLARKFSLASSLTHSS